VNVRLQVAQQRKRGPPKQFFGDKGKPWFMYEAFQFIIKAQVEYLINLGVDPALKDVVFKLWYKYLQVTGTAFTGSREGTLPTKGSIFYCRDAELLGVNKRKKSGKKNKVDDDDENDDELELCSHFSDEEFYEDDDPLNVPSKDNSDADDINRGDDWTAFSEKNHKTTEDIPASEDSSDSSEDEFVGSLTLNQPKGTKVESGHVTLQTTLAFCYLGLLWINEPVFVSDLLRWAKQGQLPYFQATRHIPQHMKFGSGDFSCLCPLRLVFIL